MDVLELLLVFSLGALGGVLGSLVAAFVLNGVYWVELMNIKRQVNAAWGTNRSKDAVASREATDAEWEAATIEAAAILQNKDLEPTQKLMQAASLAIKYPKAGKVILREAKKQFKV